MTNVRIALDHKPTKPTPPGRHLRRDKTDEWEARQDATKPTPEPRAGRCFSVEPKSGLRCGWKNIRPDHSHRAWDGEKWIIWPEPGEPAARSLAAEDWHRENRVKFLTGDRVFPYGHSTEAIEYLDEVAMLEAYHAYMAALSEGAQREIQGKEKS